MAQHLQRLTRDEPERFAAALNILAAATTTTIDDPHYDARWEILKDLPIEAVEQAARDLLKRDTPFLPSAGQWFSRALSLADDSWSDAMALPAPATPQQVEGAEEQRLTTAKDAFFANLATFIGTERANRIKANTRDEVLTYQCATCADSGWVPGDPQPQDLRRVGYAPVRLRRCLCWQARRAQAGPSPREMR
jgi:hypothetical protein